MTIVYKLDAQGGFTVGDTETRITAYSYPSSPNAIKAAKAKKIDAHAAGILKAQGRDKHIPSYDDRNWKRLEAK